MKSLNLKVVINDPISWSFSLYDFIYNVLIFIISSNWFCDVFFYLGMAQKSNFLRWLKSFLAFWVLSCSEP